MSAGVRVPLVDAQIAAEELVYALAPAAERIEVAGSIRRQSPDVGDIEIVAVPRTEEVAVQTFGMFDAPQTETMNLLTRSVAELRQAGFLEDVDSQRAEGQRYVKSVHRASGLQVDLFMVRPPASWGVLFLIRTGPAGYSQWLVTEARRRGFHVKDGALHRGGLGCGATPCDIVPTPEEADVYAALGMVFVPPNRRVAP